MNIHILCIVIKQYGIYAYQLKSYLALEYVSVKYGLLSRNETSFDLFSYLQAYSCSQMLSCNRILCCICLADNGKI